MINSCECFLFTINRLNLVIIPQPVAQCLPYKVKGLEDIRVSADDEILAQVRH